MGHRANLIVVRGGRYDLRYSHWAANTLPRDLFWGPDHAIAFTEAQPAAGQDGWLDDVWGEGGSLIDVDNRVFRLFGGEDLQYDIPLRRLYLALLAAVWEGWNVGWADEGIADLADYVGYPRENVLRPLRDDEDAPDFEPPDKLSWLDCVGSVRLDDGSIRLFPLSGELKDYLLYAPSLVEQAVTSRGMAELCLAEHTSSFPRGGFHIDVTRSSLSYWTSADQPGLPDHVAAKWPGWSSTWLRDQYEGQLAATDGLLVVPFRTPDTLFAELRATLLHPPGRSMVESVLRIAELEQAVGKPIEINPLALRDDRVECLPEEKAVTLERAAAKLGLSLNPVTPHPPTSPAGSPSAP